MRNHGKELWRNYCGTRVAYCHLRLEGYITTKHAGVKGSNYTLADKRKEKIKSASQ